MYELCFEPVDLTHIVTGLCCGFAEMFGEEGIRLVVDELETHKLSQRSDKSGGVHSPLIERPGR